jgi:hypothetical protein
MAALYAFPQLSTINRIELNQVLRLTEIKRVIACPMLWKDYLKIEVSDYLDGLEWNEIKYLTDSANDELTINPEINNLPSNNGGIYIFLIKNNLTFLNCNYLAYIGRAQFTDGQNLNKRCKEYLNDSRESIEQMLYYWGDYLYLKYAPIHDDKICASNKKIVEIEDILIKALRPPFNSETPAKKVMRTKKAFT